jgi:hypothetical protein
MPPSPFPHHRSSHGPLHPSGWQLAPLLPVPKRCTPLEGHAMVPVPNHSLGSTICAMVVRWVAAHVSPSFTRRSEGSGSCGTLFLIGIEWSIRSCTGPFYHDHVAEPGQSIIIIIIKNCSFCAYLDRCKDTLWGTRTMAYSIAKIENRWSLSTNQTERQMGA